MRDGEASLPRYERMLPTVGRSNKSSLRSESRALALLADAALHHETIIVSSDYVKSDIEKIADPLKRKDARGFERALSSVNIKSNERLIALTTEFRSECSINPLDALHASASCLGGAAFLTCDDEILDKRVCIEKFAVEREYRLRVVSLLIVLRKDGVGKDDGFAGSNG